MSQEPKPIRNVYAAIELIMKGHPLASFKDRIEVRPDAAMSWHFVLSGAIFVLRQGNTPATLAEMQSLHEFVDAI
jgi:hypothetical protein